MSPQACVHGDMYRRASEFKALAPAECGVLWSSGGSVIKAFWMLHALDSGQKEWLQGVRRPAGTSWVRGQDQAGWRQLSRGRADAGDVGMSG